MPVSRCSYVPTAPPAATVRQYLSAWLVLAALLAVAFWPLTFFGQTIASADALRALDALYAGLPPEPLRVPETLLAAYEWLRHPLVDTGIYDPAFYWIDLPNAALERDYFRRGGWPVWNPYVGLGTPLLATGQTGSFFPLKLLLYLGPLLETYSLFLTARLFMAGAFAYAYARLVSLGHWPALTGATGYMLGGFLVTHFHNVEATTAAVLPLLLWAFEHLARRRDGPSTALAGLAVAMVGTAGHPEPALYGAAAAGAYFLARARELRPAGRRTGPWADVALLLGSAALGATCSAVVVVPFLERASAAAGGLLVRADPPTVASAMHGVFLPLGLHALLPTVQPQAQFNVYAGPAALVLAAAAIRSHVARGHGNDAVRPLLVTVALTLALLLLSRGSELLPVLPFGMHAFYAVPPLAFALSMLAASGVEAVTQAARHGAAEVVSLLTPGALMALALAVAVLDLSLDESRPPGVLALLTVVLLATWASLKAARFVRERLVTRWPGTGTGSRPRIGSVEVVSAAAGVALMVGAAALHLADVGYGEWVGQAIRGSVVPASGAPAPAGSAPEAWTARGWQASGLWSLNRAGREAQLRLGAGAEPQLEWFGEGRRQALSQVDLDPLGGTVSFQLEGERYTGKVSGGFHRFVSPAAAGRQLLEVLIVSAALLALAALTTLGGRHSVRSSSGVAPIGAFLLTAVPLVQIAASRNPPQHHFSFPTTRAVSVVQESLAGAPFGRAAPIGHRVLIPNTNVLVGVRSTSLQDPLQACRYQEVVGALSTGPTGAGDARCLGQHQTDLVRLSARALHTLGAVIAVVPATDATGAASDGQGVRQVASDAGVRVFAADPPASRAFVAPLARAYGRDDPAVLALLADPQFDPRRTTLIELDSSSAPRIPRALGAAPVCAAHDPGVAAALGASAAAGGAGAARIAHESGTTVRVSASAAVPAFLVLADSDYPGWTATVGGRPAAICRANGVTRAVPLPGGDHEVVFRYAPASFAAGLGLTLGGYGLATLLVARRAAFRSHASADNIRPSRLLKDPVAGIAALILLLNVLVLLGFWLGVPV